MGPGGPPPPPEPQFPHLWPGAVGVRPGLGSTTGPWKALSPPRRVWGAAAPVTPPVPRMQDPPPRWHGGSRPGEPARGRGVPRRGQAGACGAGTHTHTHTPGPPRRSPGLPTPAGTPLPSSGFTVPDSPPSPPWARGQSQAELGVSASPIVFSARQSRRSPPTERRILGGSRPRGSPPPPPRRFVNQSADGDRLSLLPLASRAVNQRSALPLGLRFRPSPRRSAPIGGAVTPSRVLLLSGAAHQAGEPRRIGRR